MGCNCARNRGAAGAGSKAVPPGTYRVYTNGKKVYETTSQTAAEKVAKNFSNPTIYAPGVVPA